MIKLFAISLLFFPLIASANLVFETTRVDHQAETTDKEYVAVFPFANEGSEPVTIRSIKTSCGCTTPKLDKKTYQPGESGEITATFEFGSRTGHQSKIVTVITDEEKPEVFKLRLSVEIPVIMQMNPRILNWKKGEELSPKEMLITLFDTGVLEVAHPYPKGFEFNILPVEGKENEYRLQFTPTTEEAARSNFMIKFKQGPTVLAQQRGFLVMR
ncbi:MAG: DUF1573 domain-containing protein [Verrucomicrobiota bacterium]